MATYTIYLRSEEHPRTINTPPNGRTYYSIFKTQTYAETAAKVAELRASGEIVTEIRTPNYGRIWL